MDVVLKLWNRGEIQCAIVTFIFVASLYIWPSSRRVGARNTPQVVKQRIASVILTCVVVHVLHYHLNSCHLGLSFWPLNKCAESSMVQVWSVVFSAAICMLLTALLFLGPLVQLVTEFDPVEDIPDFKSLITWRNLIIGPIAEEFVFRAHMVPLLLHEGYTPTQLLLITPIYFALAHVHHIRNHGNIAEVVVQLGYTSVFGLLSTFMFTRTGNLLGPTLSHCFCNYIGVPRFDGAVGNYKLLSLYVLGVVLFFALLVPLTNPALHESVFFSQEFASTIQTATF